jgi:predicted permease
VSRTPSSGRRGEPVAVHAYRVILALLPKPVRDRDGEEMASTFSAMWAADASLPARLGCLARSFGRMPGVVAAEWWDHWRHHRYHARGVRGYERGGVDMNAIVRGVRVGLRSLSRTPSFTCSTVLLLGLGVGAVTTIFTVADHLFLRPLPYPHADRLVRVQNGSHSFPSLRDFQSMPSVEAWVASSTEEVSLTGEGDPVRLLQARVTEDFFSFFGAGPDVGRLLLPEDFGAADVVVLSFGTWERLWGRDPRVVGRTIRIDGAPVLVAGVLDAAFTQPEVMVDGVAADLWRPVDRSHPMIEDRGWHTLAVAGRLAPEATIEDAARDAAVVAERRARDVPDQYTRRDGSIVELPIVSLQEATVGGAREGLNLLLGAVTLLLLVACANVAHLSMARGLARTRELAVRRALGAGTPALAGQLFTESLLVAAAGTLVGVGMASLGLRALLALSPQALPRAEAVTLDARVLLFAAALSALTALVFGLLPSLRVAGKGVLSALRSGGRGATGGRVASSLRAALVTGEVSLSLVLVFSAGLLLRSFAGLQDEPLGFRVEDVWTMPLGLTGEDEVGPWMERLERLREAVAETPGVRSAAYGLSIPLEHTGGNRCCWRTGVARPGEESDQPTYMHPVAGDWFDVFEPRVLAGRMWSREAARAEPSPALLNESLAVALFGSAEGAVDREVEAGGAGGFRVVGVVAEDRHYGADATHGWAMYIPMEAMPFVPGSAHLAVRVEGASDDAPERLREAVWSVEPDLPVPLVRSMEQWASVATAGTRFESILFTAFGAVALLLAAGGLYGTLLYVVGLERRDMGIRLALGAKRRSLEARVLARGLRPAMLGAVFGAAAAWGAGRLLQNRLFGVEADDPSTLALAVTVLLATAALASWLPARRAGAIDPIETLREE